MRNPEDSDFCYYPFFQILVSSDGKYRPCSKHQDYITHQGEELRAGTATFEDAWNSDYMQDIRQHFHENKKFPGCSECWRMQKMGLKSMRYDSYYYDIPDAQVEDPQKPMRIEINASNVCNLRCRICYPVASTKWIKEAKELDGREEKVYINLQGENLEQLKNWADNLDEVCLFGGEPMLSEENMEMLDYFIESGHAHKIALLFNTNGTVFTEAIQNRLQQFRQVRMFFSIDDIGKRFEYQRSGANWEEVSENIRKAYEFARTAGNEHIHFKICCSFSILNAYYMPEFFDYLNLNFPGLKVFFNIIFDPKRFSVQILPEPLKAVIRERLRSIRPTFEMTEEETKTFENLITFMDFEEDVPFGEFFRLINRHDVYRKESYPEVFPEFWKRIEGYMPDFLVPGQYEEKDFLAMQSRR